MPSRNKDQQQAADRASHPPLPRQTSAARALTPRIPRWSCWRGCRRAGFHDDFSTWREMEMTGSAREETERSWHPPSAAAGGTALPALHGRLAQGKAPGASGHLGPPRLTGRVLAANCPCEMEPACSFRPSLTPPLKAQSSFMLAGRTPSTRAPGQVCGPGSPPSAAFTLLVGLSPQHYHL